MRIVDWMTGTAHRIFEDPREARLRENAIRQMDECVDYSKLGVIAGIALTILGLATLSASVFLGVFVTALGVSTLILSHDIIRVCENYREINDDATVRGRVSTSTDAYVSQIFKNTWVSGIFLESELKKALRAQKR